MSRSLRRAAAMTARLLLIPIGMLLVITSGVMIATPGASRIGGIGGLIFAGVLIGMHSSGWIESGWTRPRWAAVVRPGDTLVLALEREHTPQDASQMIQQIQRALPGVKAVLAWGVTSMAVEPAPPGGAT